MQIFSVLFLLLVFGGPAQAQQRVALVIGNSSYEHTTPLKNPRSDAALFAKTIRRLGFKVILQTDVGQRAMKRAFRDYLAELDRGGKETIGLVYYAGHGVQVNGENFIVPVDAKIDREGDVAIETVSASELVSGMRLARNKLNIVILDACRNNPYRGFSRGAARGLARLDAPKGSYVVFATAPGNVAYDGVGQNSPFTLALSKHLSTPGLTFEDVIKRVGRDVSSATGDRQRPWLSTSVYQDFFPAGQGGSNSPPVSKSSQVPKLPKITGIDKRRDELLRIAGRTFRDCENCPEMVVLPAGSFNMGSHSAKYARRNQKPLHEVTIPHPFAVGKFEVMFDEWDACRNDGGCAGYQPRDEGWGRGKRPVIRVNWEDAVTYVAWLKHRTGKNYRLLSEAEWEYAARAGAQTMFQSGDTITPYAANFDGRRSFNNGPKGRYFGRTMEVGQFKANAFGLYDMHGNVAEWISDCWHKTYEGAPSDGKSWVKPERGDQCHRRVLRGGSWFRGARDVRLAARDSMPAHIRGHEIGFRIARDLTP